MRIHIYTQNIAMLTFVTIVALVIWFVMLAKYQKTSKILALIGTMVAVYAVFSYTVIDRHPSSIHIFAFFSPNKNEFWREMFMNALLYVPLGMTVSVFLGSWTILVAFVLSLLIELWQFRMGTGLAQGTDIIMNTLGSAIGLLPYIVAKKGKLSI